MGHPLDKLFNLFEEDTATRMSDAALSQPDSPLDKLIGNVQADPKKPQERKPRPKPPLTDPNPDVKPPPDTSTHPVAKQRAVIDKAIQGGASPDDIVRKQTGGRINTVDASKQAAATFGDIADRDHPGDVDPEPGSDSLYAKMDKKEKELPKDDDKAATPMDKEVDTEEQTPELTPEQQYEQDVQTADDYIKNEFPPEKAQELRTNTQPEITPQQQQKQKERDEWLVQALDRIFETGEQTKGAGKHDLSEDDINIFKDYITRGSTPHPNVVQREVSDDDLDFAMSYLKEKYGKGKAWTRYQNMLNKKGDPPKGMSNVQRGKDVLRSYLSNGGMSWITGEPMPLSSSQLDHIQSLDNGGVDGGDNWSWMETRFNQKKSNLTDEALLEKLQKMLEVNPDDKKLKEMEKELKNKLRGGWGEYFKSKGWENLTQADINSAKGTDGMQMLKALAEVGGVSHYQDRGKQRSTGRAGGGTSVPIDELKKRLIDQLDILSQDQVDNFDEDLINLMQDLEDRQSELGSFKKEVSKRKREAKKKAKSVRECYLEWVLETKFDYYLNPDKVTYLEEEVDIPKEIDYNEDVEYLTKYGRA